MSAELCTDVGCGSCSLGCRRLIFQGMLVLGHHSIRRGLASSAAMRSSTSSSQKLKKMALIDCGRGEQMEHVNYVNTLFEVWKCLPVCGPRIPVVGPHCCLVLLRQGVAT